MLVRQGDKMKTQNLEEWEKTAVVVNNLTDKYFKLSNRLNLVPKKCHSDTMFRLEKILCKLRGDLDRRLYQEHKDKPDLSDIFYGRKRISKF